jgi:hypothetical protein
MRYTWLQRFAKVLAARNKGSYGRYERPFFPAKAVSVISVAVLLFGLIVLLRGCPQAPKNHQTKQVQAPTAIVKQLAPAIIHTIEVAMLDNIKANGFDDNPNVNGGKGGLFINWRYGTNPLQTNVNGTGAPDDASANLRHDPLTDIRYMHNLWSYKHQNPTDTRYDGEIARYTPIIKYEFDHARNERGWLFDEFMAVYNLSHDAFYKDTAYSLAEGYAGTFDPKVGSIYKKNASHSDGSYRVDNVLEAGCALVQASVIFNQPVWMQEGMSTIKFVYAHAYVAQYHTFASQMDHVLLPDGSVNPNQTFFVGTTKNYAVSGRQMQMGAVAQIAISLLDAYKLTHNRDFLSKATDLLDAYALPTNPLGMWDTQHGGYYFSVKFEGPSPADPGQFIISKAHKEVGRQIIMLQAFHIANQLTSGRYRETEDQLQSLAINKAYYAPGHGVLYDVNANWSLRRLRNGTYEDMVTTEAMGAEMESLFSLSES